jgi:hypothetical protein
MLHLGECLPLTDGGYDAPMGPLVAIVVGS